MTNIHASGGAGMMKQVVQTLGELKKRPLITAVTVLTSMDEQTLKTLGIEVSLEEQVNRLATLAKNNGIDGVVCSALEAKRLKQKLGKDFILVTPGIRLANSSQDDQHRIMTPKKALQAGSDYLVIGRPITQSDNPQKTVESILSSIAHLS